MSAEFRPRPNDFGLEFENVEVDSHGLVLRGWFVPAKRAAGEPAAQSAAVVVAHARYRTAGRALPLALPLHRAGFGVLMLDAHGHGASDGDIDSVTPSTLADDLRAAIHFLERRPDVDPERIALVGHEMGGASAILAASRDRRIRAVVSIAAFAGGSALERRETRPEIPPIPTLLIHGGADRHVAPSEMDRLWASSGGRATRLLVPGRGHAGVLRDPRCAQAMAEFLSSALAGRVAVAAPSVTPGPAVLAAVEPRGWRRPTMWKWLQGIDYSAWGP